MRVAICIHIHIYIYIYVRTHMYPSHPCIVFHVLICSQTGISMSICVNIHGNLMDALVDGWTGRLHGWMHGCFPLVMYVYLPILGGSWVVISRVICRSTILTTHLGGLITPFIATHEPPSNVVSGDEASERQRQGRLA